VKIEELITSKFKELGIVLYWPDRLIEEGVGTEDEVQGAFVALVEAGKLYSLVTIRSCDGHLCWQGTAAHYQRLDRRTRCPECNEPLDEDVSVDTHYAMTKTWQAQLRSI